MFPSFPPPIVSGGYTEEAGIITFPPLAKSASFSARVQLLNGQKWSSSERSVASRRRKELLYPTWVKFVLFIAAWSPASVPVSRYKSPVVSSIAGAPPLDHKPPPSAPLVSSNAVVCARVVLS